MKKILLGSMVVLVTTVSALGQGKVEFNNRLPGGVITHVYASLSADSTFRQVGNGSDDYPSGTQDWSGFSPIGANGTGGPFGAMTTFAQLLGATGYDQPEASLLPAVPITTFRTFASAGFIQPRTATFNNIPYDSPATIEMVAWDNFSGLYPTWAEASTAWAAGLIAAGESGTINLEMGSPTSSVPFLYGLQSFNLYFVPEPSALALAGLATACLVCLRRRDK